jgi:hypothetical protein
MEVNVVSLALAVALLASLIVNFALVNQLERAAKKLEEMRNDREW